MGEYQFDPLLLLEGPQSHWALPRSPRSCRKPNLHFLFMAVSENPQDVDQQLPQVLPTGTWLIPGNTARRPQAEAGGLEPSWPKCCSCLVSRTSLEVAREPAQYKVLSQPTDLCNKVTLQSLVQLCFVFSFGSSSLLTLNAILPWNHDYRFFLCRCLPGGCFSLPSRVTCSLG